MTSTISGRTQKITCTINGEAVTMDVDIRESLLDVLRNRLYLTGAKKGCGVGECGACTVLIDGEAYDSCLFLAVWADGKHIRTIEGEAKEGQLSRVQEAFVESGAVQCGYCIPGFVLSVTALKEQNCHCDRESLKKELSGHMCRCTGYQNIIKAAEKVLTEEK
ncbi:2Fe-2S iron-sulfur cluster binding domain-containing protein [Heliobacillus mobilis]|uniref:2Fe-2S iron-sulfur cluster binding domain-containing protein n=1 Tax=Heliobacterium mobile TaxID=28064 RepID=A0A6I3SK74_HELMO|nr:xanthine dehydrogenase subunit XdhC [Heliobacterium mobile]MTV49186.1 2Fe-2S iron-sulfur cluster binding domain-containing protein [Heliobacterium mobile]